tara:strand:- start:1524 stop:1823 length:300 start_codon:yes stop_codon:yes gene_type:complete
MGYKYNFEVATEKKQADKEMGYILIPDPDGQEKHPEHLLQHNHLQILQRHVLNGNVEQCKEMLAELPEYQVTDTIAMLKGSVLEHDKHKAEKFIKEMNW